MDAVENLGEEENGPDENAREELEEAKAAPTGPPTPVLRIKLITEHGTKLIDLNGENAEDVAGRICAEGVVASEGLQSALAYYIDKNFYRYPQQPSTYPPYYDPQYYAPNLPRTGAYYNSPY